ncbi:DUF4055 domain-containing protein [Mixta calida]|uniref:DUF4055 domain-containing protein n=1 Tax=Mixta calida TaxID=665913 RepID=UPI002FD8C6B2
MAIYEFVRPEYTEAAKSWQLVKDCVAGSKAVKGQGTLYLPMPDPTNTDKDNIARYEALLKRAMFLNVTGRTEQGLIGAVFRKTAEVDLPDSVKYLIENASGDGTSLEQLSKESSGENLETGRGGFFVDYPPLNAPDGARPTRAQTAGRFAHIHFYDAFSIINWREDVIDGVRKLTMVVFAECYNEDEGDEFSFTSKKQYRALTLDDGKYRHRLWHEGDPYETPFLDVLPTDYNGKPFDHIPFHFFGAQSNDSHIDKAPLEDLAEVNILHYGNSATVEESGFISSQPTLFFTTDIEQDEFQKWNPHGIQVGSTRGYALGKTGTATMVQASESQLSLKLMQEKENQMLMIGARIVQKSSGQETAEAARIRYSSDNSVLGTIAGNISEALKLAILDAQLYMEGRSDAEKTTFWLNQEFFDETMDAQMILAQVQLWQQGFIAKKDLRVNLRQAGIIEADRTDKDIDADRENEPPVESGGEIITEDE